MRISGFSFVRNADKLSYPVSESIRSILPLCHEFIISVGKGDGDDHTRRIIEEIGDPKIRIIDTVWPPAAQGSSHVYAEQTNLALRECTGEWCFYLQCDEVVHESFLEVIRARCERLIGDTGIQGLLLNYKHFWGDYEHHQVGHKWYPREIRIIRNGLGIESWRDAQSFRLRGKKLTVATVNAQIYHYGYVRPPRLMQRRNRAITENYRGAEAARKAFENSPERFDFGPLDKITRFSGTHPRVMQERIARMQWRDELQYSGKRLTKHNHDRFKYRLLTFVEQRFLGGRQLGGFKNYVLVKR